MTQPQTLFVLALLLALLSMASVVSAGAPPKPVDEGPAVGAPAPTFTLQDSEGQPFELTGALAKGTLVLAFFPRAFSRASIRQWEALREVAPTLDKLGVQLVGLSTDSMSTLKRFRAAHRVPYRLLSDGTGEVSERYGAIFGFEKRRLTAPKMVVVGDKGTVLYRDERYETKTDTDLRALLRAVGGD